VDTRAVLSALMSSPPPSPSLSLLLLSLPLLLLLLLLPPPPLPLLLLLLLLSAEARMLPIKYPLPRQLNAVPNWVWRRPPSWTARLGTAGPVRPTNAPSSPKAR
jgi:hypothetical protein